MKERMGIAKIKSKFILFMRDNSTELFCAICFLITYFYLASYLYPINRPLKGHDASFHYLRVEAVKYNIENHNLFSGIDYLFFGGAGYAGFAYPEFFLYIPAFLRILGMGIGESMTVFISLCNLLSYFFMFIFLKNISKSPICGTIGAVLYVLNTFRIDNIITRFALGEILAGVFWPLILYGLYDFIFDEFKKPYIIGIGFVGMVLSHTISTALALGLCVVVSIVFIKRILKTRGKLPKLLITAGCVVMVTAYYWIPLLELLFSCEMAVKESKYHTLDHAVPFVGLFKETMHNGIAGMKFPIFLLCIPRVFLTGDSPISKMYLQDEDTKKNKNILVAADVFMVIGIIMAVMSTTVAPWGFLSKFLDFMQFPWRFFAPASILLITAGTIYLFYIAEFTKVSKIAMVLLTTVAVLIAYVHTEIAKVEHNKPYNTTYYNDVEKTYTVGAGEWLPRAAQANWKKVIRDMRENVVLSNNQKIPCERKNGTLKFVLDSNENVDFARLPYIWYKGYRAADENGNSLNVTMSEDGLVQVDLRGAVGKITVEHKPTFLKTASFFVSVASVLALGAVIAVLYRKKRQAALQNIEKAE